VVRIFPDGLNFSVCKSGVALEKPVQQVYRFSRCHKSIPSEGPASLAPAVSSYLTRRSR